MDSEQVDKEVDVEDISLLLISLIELLNLEETVADRACAIVAQGDRQKSVLLFTRCGLSR